MHTRGVWGRVRGISWGEKKERKGGDANESMGGKRREAKDSKAKNQRGKLTKDGRDVASVRACDMEMTGEMKKCLDKSQRSYSRHIKVRRG